MQTKISPQRENFRLGFVAGLGAGILASALMLLLSALIGSASLPDAVGSAIALAMPLPLFTYLHETIGGDAKHYLFYVTLVGQCLIFALAAGAYSQLIDTFHWRGGRNERGQLSWGAGVILALVLWLLTGFVLLPLVGLGIFGFALLTGVVPSILGLGIVGLAFGLLFVFAHNWLLLRREQQHASTEAESQRISQEQSEQRRTFLRTGITVVGFSALGWLAWRFITGGSGSSTALSTSSQANLLKDYKSKIVPPPTPDYGTIEPIPHLSSEIIPNDQFYVVSKNLTTDPSVNGASWQLRVHGEVEKPYTLTYDQLTALPLKKQYESLMCISNEVGGTYMGNAVWEGIPLLDLLQRAGTIKPGSTKVVLRAADNYSDSIHLSKALEPTTLVALRMNGVTLPQGHGYPARLLVPGIYGMKHVKWITEIEVVNTDYQGYWQQNGWSDPAPIRMTSRIDVPLPDIALSAGKPTYIAGVAFSGNKGISRVDVSTDGGQSWQAATLKRPLSQLTWVLWHLPWQPQTGNYTITVRAIDLEGNVQGPQLAPPLPNGSSGYHTITVNVT